MRVAASSTRAPRGRLGPGSRSIRQFLAWLMEAGEAGIREPNAMTLATASATGEPSARIVLLRGVDADGFTWYTNREVTQRS